MSKIAILFVVILTISLCWTFSRFLQIQRDGDLAHALATDVAAYLNVNDIDEHSFMWSYFVDWNIRHVGRDWDADYLERNFALLRVRGKSNNAWYISIAPGRLKGLESDMNQVLKMQLIEKD